MPVNNVLSGAGVIVQYEAMCLRDDCEAGKITAEEYRQWMEGCFPNQKKPERKNPEK